MISGVNRLPPVGFNSLVVGFTGDGVAVADVGVAGAVEVAGVDGACSVPEPHADSAVPITRIATVPAITAGRRVALVVVVTAVPFSR